MIIEKGLMKQIAFGAIMLFLFAFVGCNPLKKMQKDIDKVKIEIEDEVLEVHADSVNVFFNALIPEKYFKKKAILKLEPYMVYDQDTSFLPAFFIAGEKVDYEANKINPKNSVPYVEGGKVSYKNKTLYDPRMKHATLYVVSSYKIDSEYDELDVCVCDVKEKKLSDGMITTSQTVKNTDNIEVAGSYAPITMEAEGSIYYTKDKYDLKKDQNESKDFNIPFVLDPVRDFALNEGLEFEGLSTTSQASPDGEFKRNEMLANKREESSFTFIKNYLGDAGFETIYDSAFYQPKEVSEDWDGLRDLINKSDISVKADIVKIINSDMPLDEKEDNIKKLTGDQWDYLAESVLPRLRKTEIKMVAKTKIRPVEELQRLYSENKLDSLYNKQELILLAFNTEDLDKQMELFELYKKNNPKEYVGDNNIAGVHLMKGDADKALEILEPLAKEYPNTKEIISNIGVCYRYKGDYDTAMTIYEKAESLGVDVRNNKAIVDIKTADYDLAVKTFEGERYDYNRALAFTLNKDYSGAKNVIDKIEEKSADDFYLRAIVGARMKDVDLMTTSLTRAIKLDASIRDRAKDDLEFRHYWDKQEFQNAIK